MYSCRRQTGVGKGSLRHRTDRAGSGVPRPARRTGHLVLRHLGSLEPLGTTEDLTTEWAITTPLSTLLMWLDLDGAKGEKKGAQLVLLWERFLGLTVAVGLSFAWSWW